MLTDKNKTSVHSCSYDPVSQHALTDSPREVKGQLLEAARLWSSWDQAAAEGQFNILIVFNLIWIRSFGDFAFTAQ